MKIKKSNRQMMNKKGQVQYFLENAFRIGFLIVALAVFFLLVNFYIVNRIDTNQLNGDVVTARIIYSDAIMMTDSDAQMANPGIVDMDKFNEERLNSKIDYSIKRRATAKVELINNADAKSLKIIYLNEPQYEVLDVLAKKSSGKGSATRYIHTYPVTYFDAGKYDYGTLQVTVLIPNS